jgi:plasmid stabilization system protein ParE
MYRLEYLPTARVDILAAEAYLQQFSPRAADKFTLAIERQEAVIAEHPLRYRVYEYNRRYRCMPLLYKYLCFYRIDETEQLVQIYRVLHGMRDIPNLL